MDKTILRRAHVNDLHLPATLPALLKQIYASRGVADADELLLTSQQLAPVTSLLGIEQACQVIYAAIEQQLNIVIIGDFDADGATSTRLNDGRLGFNGQQKSSFFST